MMLKLNAKVLAAGLGAILTLTTSVTCQAASPDIAPTAAWLTEAELANQSVQIEQFWQQQVVQGSLTGAAGVQLHYAYVKPAAAKASIVLISGRTESVLKYQELFYDLSRQGYAVFSMDHRGQGLSGRMLPDPQIGHIEDFQLYVDDLNAFIQKMQPEFVGKPLALAHSMGGAVLSYYLAQHPDVFQAAVLASPMHQANAKLVFGPADGCYVAAAAGWTCPDCYAGFSAQPYQAGPFAGNPYTHSELRYQRFRQAYQQPKVQLGGPSWQWLSEACDVAADLPKIAEQIKTPVLVLQAGADSIVTASAQHEFCKALGSSCHQSAVTVIPGAAHELLIEADQYRLPALNAMQAFFARYLR
jgi:lysophospholipase